MSWYKIAAKKKEKGEKPQKKWRRVDSTFIKAVSYEKDLQVLSVRLKGDKVYTFKDVSKDIYKDFLKSNSKGAFFNDTIKEKYAWSTE